MQIKAAGGIALAIKTNVMVEEEVQAMVNRVLDEWGKIDILVNNAAVAAPGPFVETTTRRWNLVIGVNLLGTFLCTKAVLPTMMRTAKREHYQYQFRSSRQQGVRGHRNRLWHGQGGD